MKGERSIFSFIFLIFLGMLLVTLFILTSVDAQSCNCYVEYERRCTSTTQYQTCLFSEGASCGTWSSQTGCGTGSCFLGSCVPNGQTCSIGQRLCFDETRYRDCVQGTSGSGEWGAYVACPADTLCIAGGGACMPIACSSNEECDDDNACTTDSCSSPGTTNAQCQHQALSCPTGYSCSAGQCIGACTNECSGAGVTQCTASGYQTCGYYDADACLDLSGIQGCPTGQVCNNGACSVTTILGMQGLQNLYRFDTDSSLQASDSVGSTNLPFYNTKDPPSLIAGKFGNAIELGPSVIRYYQFPYGFFSSKNSISVSLWFKTTSYTVLLGYQGFSLQSSPAGGWVPALYVGSDGKLRGEFWHGSVAPITSSQQVNDGKWHHVVLSADTSAQRMYLDGNLVGSAGGISTSTHSTLKYGQLGAGRTAGGWPATSGGTDYGGAAFDEVALFNRAVSAEDAYYLYATTYPSLPLDFVASTPLSPAVTSSNYVPINATINSSSLSRVTLYWQGLPITLYNESLLLSLSFDRLLQLGENATYVVDASIYSRNGTLSTGTSYERGKRGLGVRTDNAQEAVTFAPVNLPSSYTIETWSLFPLPATFGSGYRALTRSPNSELHVAVNNNGDLGVYTTAGFVSGGYNINALAGWHHFAAVSSAGRTDFYVDGSKMGSANAQIISSVVRAGNGNFDGTFGNQWGTIDEFRIWGRALNLGDIQLLSQSNVKKIWPGQWQVSAAYTGLPDGEYTYQVRAYGLGRNSTALRSIQVGDEQRFSGLPNPSVHLSFTGSEQIPVSVPGAFRRVGDITYEINGIDRTSGRFSRTTDSYIVIPSEAFPSYPRLEQSTSEYPFTFSIWFNTEKNGVILAQLTNSTEPRSLPYGWVPALYIDTSGKLRSSVFWHGSVHAQLVSPGRVNDGKWHQASVAYSNGVESLYLDGALIGTQAHSVIGNNYDYSYLLGTGYTLGWPAAVPLRSALIGHYWSQYEGLLDEMRVYHQAFNVSQVQQLYQEEYEHFSVPTSVSCVITGCASGELCIANMCVPAVPVPYRHFRFEEGYGSNARESITSILTGIPYQTNAVSWTSGIQGGGIRFTGNQFVNGPYLEVTPGKEMSLSVWFNTTSTGVIASSSNAFPLSGIPSSYAPIIYVDTQGKLRAKFWDNSFSNVYASSLRVDDGKWHHTVLTANASGQSFYLDGALAGKINTPPLLLLTNYIGTGYTNGWPRTTGGWSYFNGVIDEFMVFNVSLNREQIQALYAGESYDTEAISCTNQCGSTGSTQCLGAQVQTCGNYDTDLCLEWSTPVSCNRGYSCSVNQCTPDSSLVVGLVHDVDFDSTPGFFSYQYYSNGECRQSSWTSWLSEGRNGNGAHTEPSTYLDPFVPITPASEYSMSVWTLFPLPATPSGAHTFASSTGTSVKHLMIDNQGMLGLRNTGTFYSSGYSTSSLSGWHLITLVASAGRSDFYVDGVFKGSISQKVSDSIHFLGNSDPRNLYAGLCFVNSGDYWGTFDEFKLWNRALSASEVSQLYAT
ncbi:laminin G domain-containing protein [Candidatus Pacearchaeota archaeon]|nr:laminin G domain-containing protein [Candidatus Pacearchaeota archaeon]